MARTEEQILARLLVLHFGEAEKPLRVLGIAEGREWTKNLGSVVAAIADIDVDMSNMASLVGVITSVAGDRILELVLAYDKDNALGGKERLEAEATSEEVYLAFKQIVEVVAPFVTDVQTAMSYAQTLVRIAQSAPGNSTNSPLPNGASIRKRSKVA